MFKLKLQMTEAKARGHQTRALFFEKLIE